MKTNVWIWAECVCAMSKTEQYLRRANTWEHAEINWISQHYRLELMKFIVQVFATFHSWARKILLPHTRCRAMTLEAPPRESSNPIHFGVYVCRKYKHFFCFASLLCWWRHRLEAACFRVFQGVQQTPTLSSSSEVSLSLRVKTLFLLLFRWNWETLGKDCDFCFVCWVLHLFFLIQSSTQFADSSSHR